MLASDSGEKERERKERTAREEGGKGVTRASYVCLLHACTQSDDYDDDDEKSDRSDDSKIADMLSNSLSLHRMGSHVAAFFHAWRPSLPETEAA